MSETKTTNTHKCTKPCAKTSKPCTKPCTKANKPCTKAAKSKVCLKPATKAVKATKADNARGISEIKDKIVDAVKKIPAIVIRIQSELKQLITRLTQLDSMIEKLKSLISSGSATKETRSELALLNRQRTAMLTYRKILEERLNKYNK